MKTCNKCHGTEFLANGRCSPCTKAYQAAYRASNLDKARAEGRAWAAANKEKAAAYKADWRAANQEKVKASRAARYAANPSDAIAKSAAWMKANAKKVSAANAARYAADPERNKAAVAAWQKANPLAIRIHKQNRRIREGSGRLSTGLVERLFVLQRGMCPCCKQPLGSEFHIDHIQPLALGGTNTDENTQLLRKTCNLQKNAKHPIDFMQQRGFLL